jgi:hypothetical protein
MASTMQWGSFADAGLKELVAAADPTLNISERAVSERYVLADEIGCGSYGRAVRATRKDDGLEVVVKQIRLYEMDEKSRMVSCWLTQALSRVPRDPSPPLRARTVLHAHPADCMAAHASSYPPFLPAACFSHPQSAHL